MYDGSNDNFFTSDDEKVLLFVESELAILIFILGLEHGLCPLLLDKAGAESHSSRSFL